MKKHGAFWMHLYPLLLFAIIVLSLLFLVMTGTGLYSAVVDSQTRNREARAALSYLAARVHAADAAGAVSVADEKVTDISTKYTLDDFKGEGLIIRRGKKKFAKVVAE